MTTDDYQIYNSNGKVVFEMEFSRRTNPDGQEMVVFLSPSGEKLAELSAKTGEDGKTTLSLKRIY